MSLTKKDIANTLVDQMDINYIHAAMIVDNFFDIIKQTLATGEEIKISGFGNFVLNEKNARPGRNPKTGEEYTISARRVVTFKAGTKLKSIVNNN